MSVLVLALEDLKRREYEARPTLYRPSLGFFLATSERWELFKEP